jgi:DNA polymerase-3 subunit delta
MKKKIYLLYGEEDFLIDEKIDELKRSISNPSLNIEVIEGEEVSLEKLAAAFQTTPMFGGEKLVIVRDFEINSEKQESLLSLLENLSPQVTVVFKGTKIDQRSKFYKFIDLKGEVIEYKGFAPWQQHELRSWLRERAQRHDKKISESAINLLAEICGLNLRFLAEEIEKLVTYVGEREEIEENDVLALASPGEKNVFHLLEALRFKNTKKALKVFQDLFKNKEDLSYLLATIASQYRLMLLIKSSKTTNPSLLAQQAKASPYFVKKCLENINFFSLEELKRNFEYLLQANLRLRTNEEPQVVFEMLLTSLCGA